MTVTVPGNVNVLVVLLLVILLVVLIVSTTRRDPAPSWTLPRILYLVAFLCFMLAALGLAQFPWLPIGLACWVGAILAG